MTVNLTNPSDLGGGGYFKPRAHLTSLAVLIEPTKIQHNVPHTFKGVSQGEKDVVTADITVFATQADFEAGAEPQILKGVTIDKPGLTRPLEQIIGGAMMAKVVLKNSAKTGSEYFAWDNIEDNAIAQGVTNYLNEREAAVKAATDAAPDFD